MMMADEISERLSLVEEEFRLFSMFQGLEIHLSSRCRESAFCSGIAAR